MTIYVIVDINGKTHEITADNYDIKDGLMKFYANGDICDIFVVENVISITFGSGEFISMAELFDKEVEPNCEVVLEDSHKSCSTCKYSSKKLTDEPCMTCNPWCNKWEAKDDQATL